MLRDFAPLYSSKKLALRFFCMEQQKNTTLHSLSAVQRKKVMLRMFKELSAKDIEDLKVKAAAWEAKKIEVNNVGHSCKKRTDITPYELFFKEQLSNPSIASIVSPAVREKKLFAIYNSLPDATREALELRARSLSWGDTAGKVSPPPGRQRTASKIKPKKKSQTGGTKSEKSKDKKKNALVQKKTFKRSVASPFAVFVREQMPSVKQFPTKERMKIIAQKWRALKAKSSEEVPAPTGAAIADSLSLVTVT